MKKILLANYFGQGWSALMGIAFLPLIIKSIGAEAYGLVGVYAMLQAWFALLDMGITPTLNREMARYIGGAHSSQSIRDLLRSLEALFIVIAFIIGASIWLSSDFLAIHWLRSESLNVEDIAQAISIMAVVIALRFIESIYRGALIGLQKQVLLNIANALLATMRWGGVASLLIWVEPSIKIFFFWQGLMSVITTLLFIIILYTNLPHYNKSARFSWFQLKSVWPFARLMIIQTLLTLLLTQVDKLLLSRLLTLEMFGYYSLASTFANTLIQLITPVTMTYYPRFTELVTNGDMNTLIKLYHQSAQLVTVLIMPLTIIFVIFGEKILLLWGGGEVLAYNAAPILAILAVGTMLNGLMNIPYMLTLAYGWPGFFVRVNIIAVIVLVPSMVWIAPRYGAIGSALIWVVLNMGYLLLASRNLYKHILIKEMWSWYRFDLMQPIIGACSVATFFLYLQSIFSSNTFSLLWIVIIGICMLSASAFCAPIIRNNLFYLLKCKTKL